MIERLGVVGLGLIGGSIGLGARGSVARSVVGWDTCPAHRQTAQARGVVDELVEPEAMGRCELIVLAVPPGALSGVFTRLPDGPATTDVASVKVAAREACPPGRRSRFVPGHPMAGLEVGGPSNARPDLFHGARWALCCQGVDARAAELVRFLVRGLRALPVEMTPEEHDDHVALLSHLPHVLAAALLSNSASLRVPELAGGSWRDLTRVGGAEPQLWADILLHNRGSMNAAMAALRQALDDFTQALDGEDRQALEALFERAREAKR